MFVMSMTYRTDRDRRRPVARIGPIARDAGWDRALVGGQPTRRLGLSRSDCDEQREDERAHPPIFLQVSVAETLPSEFLTDSVSRSSTNS